MFNNEESVNTGDSLFENDHKASELTGLIEGILENEQRQLAEIDKMRQSLVNLERTRGQEIENLRREKIDIETIRRNEAERMNIMLQNKEEEKNREIALAKQRAREELETMSSNLQGDYDQRLLEEVTKLRSEYDAKRKSEMAEVNRRMELMLAEHQSMLEDAISKINAAYAALSNNAATRLNDVVNNIQNEQSTGFANESVAFHQFSQPMEQEQPVQQISHPAMSQQPAHPSQPELVITPAQEEISEDRAVDNELDKITELFKLQEQRMKKMSEYLN